MSDERKITSTIHLVFCHLERFKGGEWGQSFRICDEHGRNLGRAVGFTKSRGSDMTRAVPGEIFEVTGELAADGGVTIIPTSARSVARLPAGDPSVVEWSAAHKARRAVQESERAVKGRRRVDAFTSALEPLHVAYLKESAAGRAQLLAQVVRFITNGE